MVKLSRLEVVSYILLFSVGIILIFLSDSSILEIFDSIGSEFIVVVVLFFFFRILLVDPTSELRKLISDMPALLRSAFGSGVEMIYANVRSDVPVQVWFEEMEKAQKEIRILSVSLKWHNATSEFFNIINLSSG
jgi:hypothetical protein